jgi:hypothetical protein
MLTEEEILSTLDDPNNFRNYNHFIDLGHPYVYHIDCRLNIFRGDNDRWAIAAEHLGFNERGAGIELEINYFGNCLQNLEAPDGHEMRNYRILSVDEDSFTESVDDIGFCLNPDAKYWLIGSQKVMLSTNKQDYLDNDIELKEYEPDEIAVEEAARLAIIKYSAAFRATDDQLYKSIPRDLKKILVLDEWYHKDYVQLPTVSFSDDKLSSVFNFNKELGGLQGLDLNQVADLIKSQESKTNEHNIQQYNENRPGVYETWQQLAKVIATGDISFYKPTLPPNTHWSNWPESGSL